ncbi:ankyrin repeat domain protein [Pedobacter sp. BAL39]|nr:ankyrin repeat domain protein [Pedobacter sp. BAL39]
MENKFSIYFMPHSQALLAALKSSNFPETANLLENSGAIKLEVSEYEWSQLLDQLLREKAFDTLLLLLQHNIIEKDIYEYDTFRASLFEKILRYRPVDEDFLGFLERFFSELDNINDEVKGQTLFSWALDEGADLFFFKALIAAGFDLGQVNSAEQGYLHQVAQNTRVKPETSMELAELLLSEGADVNAQDIVRKTPLMTALSRNKKALVSLLMEHGADANLPDQTGETPFYYAVVALLDPQLYEEMRNHQQPDSDIQTRDGVTILFEYLKRMSNRASENDIRLLKSLIEDGADLLQPAIFYGNEKTPLDVSAEKSFEVFKTIIDLDRVDVNHADDHGDTLLHKVCAYNVNYDQDMAKDTYRKVKYLLERGANPNVTNNKDQSPMDLASTDNLKTKTVALLLAHKS